MNLLFSIFFGAGFAGFAYSTFVKRVGYSNTQNVAILTGVIFVLATIVFYTVLAFVLNV
jgi:hypothetical protein